MASRARRIARAAEPCLVALLLILACAFACACSSSSGDGVAATVEGEEITEQAVSDYISSFRNGMGYADDSAWAQYLGDSGKTAADIRHSTIVELAGDVVIQKEADRLGLSASDEEIDAKVSEFRKTLLAEDDDTWNSTLEQYNTTESDLRERYRKEILKEKVFEKDVPKTDPTDEDIESYIEENLAGTTTKRFEVFYNPDYTTMQAQLKKIEKASSQKAGLAAARRAAISVEQAAKAKSSKKIVYEVFGWDLDSATTTAMKQALSELKKGQMSDVLVSDGDVNAYEIIHVLDSYTFPTKDPDVSKLPRSLRKTLAGFAQDRVWDLSCNSWLAKQIDANLQENEMPQGLSYDVQPASSTDGSESDSEASSAEDGE